MADLLIQHLKKKSEEHSALQSLFSQWDFDQKLIPKALQNVSTLFPHYSRHDESHSLQILINIERLLGDNIALLSASDTWLILEAAYWHDIGMVVPQSEIVNALADPEFFLFLDIYTSQSHHELHAVAKSLKSGNEPFNAFFDGAPVVTVTRFRELMAEWFRRKHPTRSDQIVQSPYSSVGISSPRTELIPKRLFGLLGNICRMHGASFETIMGAGGLSFREAGLARDDCHPRFVACMLRLGDLLDLDDNRFCPVMQSMAGENRPALSRAHEDKHAAIRHLRIDQERISIDAECQTIDGYLESFNWFSWLRQEVQLQMSNWRDIVPNRELGLLPMLGPISVRLGGNLKILKNGERPAFSLDAKKAIELLQGDNLYDNEYACIRELLQNAVDATMLKIWMTGGSTLRESDLGDPYGERVRSLFENNPINVRLEQSTADPVAGENFSSWTLTIQDTGTGISLDDLQYMLRIGGSQGNLARRRVIDTMPEWMKPAGAFGIGFQSIFMLCDSVSVRTKSLSSNEILDITMYSPLRERDGLIVVSQLPDDISAPVGTTVKVNFQLDKFTKRFSMSPMDRSSIAKNLLDSLDPVLDEHFPLVAAKIADQVIEFNLYSFIPIRGTLSTNAGLYSLDRQTDDAASADKAKPWQFVKTALSTVALRYFPEARTRSYDAVNTFYRGQKFEYKNFYLPNASLDINLLSGAAGTWLNFSRDKVSAKATQNLGDTILASLQAAVKADLCAARKGSVQLKSRSATSLFLRSMALQYGGEWISLADSLGDAWLDVKLNSEDTSLRDLFNRDEWTAAVRSDNDDVVQGTQDIIVISDFDLIIAIIASEWMKNSGRFIQMVGHPLVFSRAEYLDLVSRIRKERPNIHVDIHAALRPKLRFTKSQADPYDRAALVTELYYMSRITHINERFYCYVGDGFEKLSLAGAVPRARALFPYTRPTTPKVLLPFLFLGSRRNNSNIEATPEQIDALSRWVQPKLEQSLDLSKIKSLYYELINWIDNDVMIGTAFNDQWRNARGLTS